MMTTTKYCISRLQKNYRIVEIIELKLDLIL